jgi:hypothetical protein
MLDALLDVFSIQESPSMTCPGRLGASRMRVADVGPEEFDEAHPRTVASGLDEGICAGSIRLSPRARHRR